MAGIHCYGRFAEGVECLFGQLNAVVAGVGIMMRLCHRRSMPVRHKEKKISVRVSFIVAMVDLFIFFFFQEMEKIFYL